MSDQEYTLYREPWFLSRDNDSEEWQITDGVEGFPMRNASDTEFGLALAGTLERDRAAHEAEVARAAAEKAWDECRVASGELVNVGARYSVEWVPDLTNPYRLEQNDE